MMPEWDGAGSSTPSRGQHQEQQTGYTLSDASNWFTPETTPTHHPTPQATPTPTPMTPLYFWERNDLKHEDSANDNQTTPRQAPAQPALNALPPSMGTPVAWSAGHGNHGYYGYKGAANSYGSEYGSNGEYHYGTNHEIQGVSSGASSSASSAQAYQLYPGAHQLYLGAHQSYPGAHPEVYSRVYPANYSNSTSTSNTQQYIRNVNEAHQAYPTDYSNNAGISNIQQYTHDGELANAEEGRSNQN